MCYIYWPRLTQKIACHPSKQRITSVNSKWKQSIQLLQLSMGFISQNNNGYRICKAEDDNANVLKLNF